MLKSVFIEYLVKNKERSNGSEFRLTKNAPPEIRKEMRKWRDRRILSDLPYMVSDFLLEDLKAGKAKKTATSIAEAGRRGKRRRSAR